MKLPTNYDELHWTERKKAREEYVRLQEGNCYYCKNSLYEEASEEVKAKKINTRLFPKSFFTWPVHLHHCHKTGMTIGAVHNKCNAVLWQYHNE